MATTATSTRSASRILLNPGDPDVMKVTGTLAADCYPGQAVYFNNSTNKWDLADAGTAAHLLGRVGIIDYRQRYVKTHAAAMFPDIDDYYDVSEGDDQADIILQGICQAFIVDQNAARNVGTRLIPSTTAGSLNIQVVASGDAVATLATKVIDDDTRCVIGLGSRFLGAVWGGT